MRTSDDLVRPAADPLLRVTARANDDGPQVAVLGRSAPARSHRARASRGLRLLAGFGALRRDQLEALLLGDLDLTAQSRRVATYRVIAELRERALVQDRGGVVAASRSTAYTLTLAGHRLYAASDPGYPRRRRSRTLSLMLLDHALALADIALAFSTASRQAGDTSLLWESDWEALARIGSAIVVPDALVSLERTGWRTRAFIEADRATEWQSAFASKVRRYIDLYRRDEWRRSMAAWPLVLTVTTSDAHARSLARLANRITADDGAARITRSFRFTSLEAIRVGGALAPIWYVDGSAEGTAILDASAADSHGDVA